MHIKQSAHLAALAGLCLGAMASTALATENGSSNYPHGVETVASGIMPAPGFTLFNYNQYYSASSFRNGEGDSVLPNFEADVFATIVRPFYVLPIEALGGAHLGLSLVVPVVSGELQLPFGTGEDTSIGDVALQGHIGWHGETYHHKFELAITAPTGSYEPTDIFNVGNNVWSASLDYAFTWFTPIPGIELSAQSGILGYGENPDTHYQNGIQVFSDFGVNYHPDQNWVFGVGGYGSFQISDDERDGVPVGPDGGRTSVFALGPQIGYRAENWGLLAKWQSEVAVENKAKGDRFWLQGFIPF